MKTLRLILGDQLNIKHSWFIQPDENISYCVLEMRQETDYVKHHIQKVVGFFASMRAFAKGLSDNGYTVIYYEINDSNNKQTLTQNLSQLIDEHAIEKFEYQLPDEYRLDQQLLEYCKTLAIQSKSYDSEHFYTSRNELADFFKDKKQFIMENFYRHMRKKHDILMTLDQPDGGQWNFDQSNRKKWKGKETIPSHKAFKNDITTLLDEIKLSGIETLGNIDKNHFDYPITRKQAISQLKYFCEELLVHFGDYQDAMHTDEINLFHSRLSFALNTKMISPKDIISTVLNYYQIKKEAIQISQVEGFVRQIVGWREYMRGMYWMLMPTYKTLNDLENINELPNFYWTGNTKMNCLKNSIQNSLDHGHAHHIQRLMITGNFALLTQVHPDEVDAWYLGIYADAIEWVQVTNTRGMSQFADGGKIATKPYVSSGSYINKMSNYCTNCHYNVKERIGENGCPFNSLYWNFLDDKRQYLATNYRMRMMYNLLDKIPVEDLNNMKKRAQKIINNPDEF